ncbi:hypothetical protein C7H19_11380 [Aphanothece hegewaldii CCALA 016]|uniref:Acyltransferase 3 domain-containing protein n=1 Tax=Aphanothece hegewaldii CCALA 016 TaxID=2107694 RepID=A0A2T1LY46_9CHRO|nr:acyltransferase [Aphanothece hegewaldii]PSF37312.1 hypothetical protein C7H19_11380 [Aphanothece hegewaldii CCALA 016]
MTSEHSVQNSKKSRRLDWIDQTKGLAILCIVIFHFFQNYPKDLYLITFLDQEGAKIALAAVDLFFVIAGFTTSYVMILKLEKSNLSLTSINFKSWLISRLMRIYPAYLLAVFCSLLLFYFFQLLPPFNLNLILSILGLADYHAQSINPGFWFFRVLLQAYLIMPLILPIAIKNPVMILLLGIFGGVVFKIIGLSLPQTSWLFPYYSQNNSIGSYWFQLCLGLYWGNLFYYKNKFVKVDYIVSTVFFLVGSSLFILLPFWGINATYKLGVDICLTPLLFLINYLLFTILNEKINLTKIISWILAGLSILGNYSYQIYLIHQPLYFVVFSSLTKSLSLDGYLKVFVIFVISIILLIVYVFGFTHLEKWVQKKIKFMLPN